MDWNVEECLISTTGKLKHPQSNLLHYNCVPAAISTVSFSFLFLQFLSAVWNGKWYYLMRRDSSTPLVSPSWINKQYWTHLLNIRGLISKWVWVESNKSYLCTKVAKLTITKKNMYTSSFHVYPILGTFWRPVPAMINLISHQRWFPTNVSKRFMQMSCNCNWAFE